MVLFSSVIYAFAFKTFAEAGNLFPGGFAGISRLTSKLLNEFTGIDVSFGMIYFGLNIICAPLVFHYVGRWFTVFSVLWFTSASVLTGILPSYPLTGEILLIAVFGGLLNGFAVGMALQNDASSGGTDFLAIFFSTKYNIPTWNYILGLNICVLLIAGYLYGWDSALYSIIFQFCSTQVVNTMHKRYKLVRLFIVTEKPDDVSIAIFHTCRHGITKVNAVGEYSGKGTSVLFSTINAYQLKDVLTAIKGADEHVFVDISHSERVIGNYYQKPLE